MTYAPKSIVDAAGVWTSNGGVNLGIVGNTSHTVGYHLGKDRIFDGTGPGLGWSDYSVKISRDRNGLSNAASALDLGRLNGSLTRLYEFSEWLVKQCKAGAAGTKDVREIIYWSVPNQRVQRWSGEDNQIHWGPGNGDLSHKTHTHISFYRDSESRSKTGLFTPYFEEGNMGLKVYLTATRDTVPWDDFGTAKLTVAGVKRVSDGADVPLAAGTSLGTVQLGTLDGAAIVAFNHNGETHVAPKANVSFSAVAPPASGPADCTDAVNAAKAAGVAEGKVAGYAEGKTVGFSEGKTAGVAEGTINEKGRLRTFLGL